VLERAGVKGEEVRGIGLAYQMHGLVVVDERLEVLRPAIIWCDGRAVEQGRRAFEALGRETCLQRLLNSPGNFTASKLAWVREQEPEIFRRVRHFLLPGDYIALRMTGRPATTVSGLSEGILWDFRAEQPAHFLLEHFGIPAELLPPLVPTFGEQGRLDAEAARALGLPPGVPVTYRAGDQPNNALALDVLEPGEVAATGGTSGVVYGVVERPAYDVRSRVNAFAHVNHSPAAPRIGILLCINGAGILYAWLRKQSLGGALSYDSMEALAEQAPPGADGLTLLPFGNGPERLLENAFPGAQLLHLDLNRHTRSHLLRAALEGVAFAFAQGMEVLQELGLDLSTLRAGNDNLFRSRIFSETIASLLGCRIELLDTTGAVGAARAAGLGAGLYDSLRTGGRPQPIRVYEPAPSPNTLREAFLRWREDLQHILARLPA